MTHFPVARPSWVGAEWVLRKPPPPTGAQDPGGGWQKPRQSSKLLTALEIPEAQKIHAGHTKRTTRPEETAL